MNVTDTQLQDFIDAWKADFGETLSPDEARTEAHRLIHFFNDMEEGLSDQRRKAKESQPKSELDTLRDAWTKRSVS